MSAAPPTTPRPSKPATVAPEPILSRAAIAGHPLHPMLIHFPVAALIGLVGTDAAWLWTQDPFWARVGLWLAGVGAVGGWIASIAGLIDLLTVERIRRLVTAWGHALLAVMMLSLASMNWALRWRGADPAEWLWPWGAAITGLTALFIALAAYLGGRLVYEKGVAVDLTPD
ncbi:MAG: DUF2231 domain-containing protein [Comamonadaceae bacterium]|nr:MAG: DUF2231 domain-containing protein [Comamonadaceae bacterium]